MELTELCKIFSNFGCKKVYVKSLSPNDNSKNQVYLAGSYDILNILPIDEIYSDSNGDWKRDRFKASLNFFWISEEGKLNKAPNAQLILYPKYPEVRFSGFLSRCENAPSELMSTRLEGRLFFMSVTADGKVIGFVTSPSSKIAEDFKNLSDLESYGVFKVFKLFEQLNEREILLKELKRIYLLDWIKSKRLNTSGDIIDCEAPNCGGYTLEAELGIIPNGFSEPDFLGWELKQFGVKNFERTNNSIITLMTPEPNGGFYKDLGVEYFLRHYGYEDLMGREDRINFGGIHKIGQLHPRTNLRMELIGFDFNSQKITNTNGRISLIDDNDNETASWTFSSLIKHWNRKHNQACFIPSLTSSDPYRQYKFGNNILLGTGTDFTFVLKQLGEGNIYYDPGIKMENISTNPRIKRRSQFRIKSGSLKTLYKKSELIDLINSD